MGYNWICTVFAVHVLGNTVWSVHAGTGLYMGPYFPSPQSRNITVHQNAVAYLPCSVKQLGDKSVSWVRQRDADILTVDRYTFVRDERFTVHYTSDTETWTLVIKYVQERDAGTYECQISTEPKMAMLVHLKVIVPQVEVKGVADKYVRLGSPARMECTVSSTVQLPDYIFWYRSGERLLEYDNPRVKITVTRRGGQGSEMSVTSTLLITDAKPSDAGNYTCLPSNLHSATTVLHVLNDEHPAAMKTSGAMATYHSSRGIFFIIFLSLICAYCQLDITNISVSRKHLQSLGNIDSSNAHPNSLHTSSQRKKHKRELHSDHEKKNSKIQGCQQHSGCFTVDVVIPLTEVDYRPKNLQGQLRATACVSTSEI